MSHFADSEWVDLTRGVLEQRKAAEMMEHAESCESCAHLRRVWSRVSVLGGEESAYFLPDEDVQRAKGIFKGKAPLRVSEAAAQVARMLWDWVPEPLPAGFRTVASSSRHMLFESEDHFVDLLIEDGPDPTRASLVGQVVGRGESSLGASGLDVELLTEGKLVARTVTNEFGEFRLELDSEKGHRVTIVVSPAPIVLRLQSKSRSSEPGR